MLKDMCKAMAAPSFSKGEGGGKNVKRRIVSLFSCQELQTE